ncbi:hypothetical protein SAMN04488103_10276 [Gemmobacter aquatilis]|uniref:Uncharacterized protein n=1 Tax=Gemmobacter aquatilis TaxID=933059 RepID=A0A1H8B7Q6_9RHOB|nr:hypothetical protein [Gemmobacter aquatilis]SEM78716.1 hypothetical protein SAMN04488103_10276 [Gemmobacter aquatilis]
MSNVVRFATHTRSPRAAQAPGALAPLLTSFAQHRRREGDAFWLKENAELLGILAACGTRLPDLALAVYQPFHDAIETQIAFYPQYYRMLLGLTLSLETLGLAGGKSAALAAWIVAQGWPESEVNDLQRAETRYLLARAGQVIDEPGLDARLMRFLSRPAVFALPNPRAAYDLLHVIFYLSHYGQRPLDLPEPARLSLLHLGCLAHLEQNGDLLAEVCLALRFTGQPQPASWRAFCEAEASAFRVERGACEDSSDAYHNYLVNQWLLSVNGATAFCEHFVAGPMRIRLDKPLISPLREWSQALLSLGEGRSADWPEMRIRCAPHLSGRALELADQGAADSPGFETFFAAFARASTPVRAAPHSLRVGA